jgi:hypothetical protein
MNDENVGFEVAFLSIELKIDDASRFIFAATLGVLVVNGYKDVRKLRLNREQVDRGERIIVGPY